MLKVASFWNENDDTLNEKLSELQTRPGVRVVRITRELVAYNDGGHLMPSIRAVADCITVIFKETATEEGHG